MNNLYPTLFPNYNHLSVQPSTIPGGGDGLFADIALIKGEIVVMMNVPRKMPSKEWGICTPRSTGSHTTQGFT